MTVQKQAVKVLHQRMLASDSNEQRLRVRKLLDVAKTKLDSARGIVQEAKEKKRSARSKEWDDMDAMKIKLARQNVEMLSAEVTKAQGAIKGLHTKIAAATAAAASKAKKVSLMEERHDMSDFSKMKSAVASLRGELKEANEDRAKDVSEAAVTKAKKDAATSAGATTTHN